ncbi:hypothetical protein JAAARDRAFT_28479 [Jaapia argillacea MUCL 33604]|uniref:DUF1640 domain-containing protein n=1 Tax=Jaapia argillacea MUCL 33604 TaxID=933084 RepID=A0A067QCY1_9AGAM|nr:hypothetical protein JAAARDRAFT_28479 [Jaapia argillacea MUCL 33604]
MYSSLARQLPRLSRSLHTSDPHFPSSPASSPTQIISTPPSYPHRDAHTDQRIHDPPPNSVENSERLISVSPSFSNHPRDPAVQSWNASDGSENTLTPSPAGPPNLASDASGDATATTLPVPHAPANSTYSNPPFHTHLFFTALERSFPTPVARGLMRATRALLVDRIGRVRKEGLTTKDLDNQAYLFKAAISELRSDLSMHHGNEIGTMRTANGTLRREIDALDQKMKEDITNLKHEIQMDMDSRKTEYKTELKRQDIQIEDLLNKSIVTIGDLRTAMEEARWDNMRKSVVALAGFVVVCIFGLELRPKAPPNPPPKPPPEVKVPEAEGLERTDYIT